MADLDLELWGSGGGGGGGFVLLASAAFLLSVIFSFTQNKGVLGAPGPSPRSAIGNYMRKLCDMANRPLK